MNGTPPLQMPLPLAAREPLERALEMKGFIQNFTSQALLVRDPVWIRPKPQQRAFAISLACLVFPELVSLHGENLKKVLQIHNADPLTARKNRILQPGLAAALDSLLMRLHPGEDPAIDVQSLASGLAMGPILNRRGFFLFQPSSPKYPQGTSEWIQNILIRFQRGPENARPGIRNLGEISCPAGKPALLTAVPDKLSAAYAGKSVLAAYRGRKTPFVPSSSRSFLVTSLWAHTEDIVLATQETQKTQGTYQISASLVVEESLKHTLQCRLRGDSTGPAPFSQEDPLERVHLHAPTEGALCDAIQEFLRDAQNSDQTRHTRKSERKFESKIWQQMATISCRALKLRNGLFPDISGNTGATRTEIWQPRKPVLEILCKEIPDWYPRHHPVPLSVPCGLSDLEPPIPAATKIPIKIIREDLLSEAQLEAFCRIRDAHENGNDGSLFRPGFLLGDGTGTGKGRIIASLAATLWGEGIRRSLWVSATPSLAGDALRDWRAMGGAPESFLDLSLTENQQAAAYLPDGLMFCSYSTLRTRLPEITAWLRPGSLVAFDESQALGNEKSGQGAAAVRLQRENPDLRVVYTSSTPFRRAGNLAYTQRLGLWGSSGTGFVETENLLDAVRDTGLAGMETIQRQLCASSRATTRSLSVAGVENSPVLVSRDEDFENSYNVWAQAWKIIHGLMQDALNLTSAQAASAIPTGPFTAICQSFFSHLLCASKGPELIRLMEKDIAEGRAPVIQLSSTLESFAKRHIAQWQEAEGLDPGEKLRLPPDTDLSMKDDFRNLVKEKFPIHMMKTEPLPNGLSHEVKVLDSQGNPVVNPKALIFREQAMQALANQVVLPPLLDQLVWHFGRNLAEVTGRSCRTEKARDSWLDVKNRNRELCTQEASEFLDGTRKALVFSGAGAHGRSYHADAGCRNQARRVHYLVQPSWGIDDVVQGLGRSHRTNQTSAPIIRVVSTTIPGEKRFFSTTCRRLEELGALTRGDRRAQGNEILDSRDNLDSPPGREALRRVVGMTSPEPEQQKRYHGGLVGNPRWKGYSKKDLDALFVRDIHEDNPHVNGFLNTLMTWTTNDQDDFMEKFSEEMNDAHKELAAKNLLDAGIQPMKTITSNQLCEMKFPRNSQNSQNSQIDFGITVLGVSSREYISNNLISGFSELVRHMDPTCIGQKGSLIERIWLDTSLNTAIAFQMKNVPKKNAIFLFSTHGASSHSAYGVNADGTIGNALLTDMLKAWRGSGVPSPASLVLTPDLRGTGNLVQRKSTGSQAQNAPVKYETAFRQVWQHLDRQWDPARRTNQKYRPGNKHVQRNCLALIHGNLLRVWHSCRMRSRERNVPMRIQKIAYRDLQGRPVQRTGFILPFTPAMQIFQEFCRR